MAETLGRDMQEFVNRVLEQVPFYGSAKQVAETFQGLEMVYDADNEHSLFDALATYAEREADTSAAA